ncbi:MAG: 2-oxoglutarate dehydrogenase complex dihydrolipoyllysine-residue succinyltransferase, partial [Pseudomonadota bacterium]
MAEDVKVPELGESVTEATIGQWFKQVGDAVAQDEPIAELETDKVAMEVPAPVAGVITELVAAEGDTVEVGALIAKIGEGDGASAAAPQKTEAPAAPPPAVQTAHTPAAPAPSQTVSGAPADAMPLAPAVRRIVEDYDLDPASITGTGKDGRLTKADVLKAIDTGTAKKKGAAPEPQAQVAAAQGPREERVRMTRLRQRIAERLKEAQNTAAMLTTFNEADMTEVMALRNSYKDVFAKKHGIKLGFMSFFVKACCHALQEVPAVNARIDGDEIVFSKFVNMAVAVSAPNGLVVPVIKDADAMSFADCELAIADFGKRAQEGKLELSELQGGTFTISNGGTFGSLLSAPILNPPQSGILGMHKIQQRPMAVNGQVEIRPMMYLSLSYDHRIIDGRE